jgi:hypothetical protein
LEEIRLGKKEKTYAAYSTALRYFEECCTKTHLEDLEQKDLLKFSAYLRDEKDQAARTVNAAGATGIRRAPHLEYGSCSPRRNEEGRRRDTVSGFTIRDLTRHKSGRLTVRAFAGMGNGRATWLCDCACGRTTIVSGHKLASGETRSCGCLRIKHGKAKLRNRSPEYVTWLDMKAPCADPKHISYKNYGGRGITVCPEWLRCFPAFYRDIGPRPPGMTLDRIENNGNYEPGNCKWSTRTEQNHNARPKGKRTPEVRGEK